MEEHVCGSSRRLGVTRNIVPLDSTPCNQTKQQRTRQHTLGAGPAETLGAVDIGGSSSQIVFALEKAADKHKAKALLRGVKVRACVDACVGPWVDTCE